MKPVKRSQIRILAGTYAYRTMRYIKWYLGSTKFAGQRQPRLLDVSVSRHQTPLLRQLHNVDMSLQYNKINNLQIAIGTLNGIVVQPGETMSYWKLIGKPTRRKGYVEGMVLFYGRFKPGIGGGLCQLSNLIYWITLHTPLTVVERHRHSYDVFPDVGRTQPFGSGATCAYNYLDLQIHNPTNEPYQLALHLTNEHLVGEWRTAKAPGRRYEVYEKEHRMIQQHWGGYIRYNQIYRKVFNGINELIADEFIAENRALMMYSPLLAEQADAVIDGPR